MKRTIIIILALVFSVSFCMAQGGNIKGEIDRVKQEYENIIESAKKDVEQGRYDAAIAKYQKAITLKSETADSNNAEIAKIRKLKSDANSKAESEARDLRYKNAIASAEANFAAGRYQEAKNDYLTAIEIKPENTSLFTDKIAELDELILKKELEDTIRSIEERYNKAITSAEINVAQRRWGDAKQDYITARGLKPENADLIDSKIAELEKPAQLNIYHKGSILGIFEDNYDILLENVIVGRTKNKKWKTTVTVDELETKTVWAAIDERSSEVHIDFEPGKVYYVRCGLSSRKIKTGVWKTRKKKDGTTERYEETITEYTPKLELVSVSVGEREFKSIKSK